MLFFKISKSDAVLMPLPVLAQALESVGSPLQLEKAKSCGREAQWAPATQVEILLAVIIEVQRAPISESRADNHNHWYSARPETRTLSLRTRWCADR